MPRATIKSRIGSFSTTYDTENVVDYKLAKEEVADYEVKYYADLQHNYVGRTITEAEKIRGQVTRPDIRNHMQKALAQNWSPRKAAAPEESTVYSRGLDQIREHSDPRLAKAMKIKDRQQRLEALYQYHHDREIEKRNEASAPKPMLETKDYKDLTALANEVSWDPTIPLTEVDLYRQACQQHEYAEGCPLEAAKLAAEYFEARESRLKAVEEEQQRQLDQLNLQRQEILNKRMRKTKREQEEQDAAEAEALKTATSNLGIPDASQPLVDQIRGQE